MIVRCKSLFKDNASMGSHLYEQAVEKKDTIYIDHDHKIMTIPPEKYNKFFEMGKKEYPHTDGREGTYTLKYIKFIPDEGETGNFK